MLKKYDKYKDSGIQWIGKIPSSWTIKKVKNAFIRKKDTCNEENPVILSLTNKGVKFRDISNNEGQIAESYFNYNPVEIGDILLNPMDLVSNAFSAVSDKEGVISPAYVNLKTKAGYHNKYYDYYFKLQYWGMAFFAHGKGVSFENRWTLNNETLMNYFIPCPDFQEQQIIAKYLDNKCTEIDNAIETEKNVIEKLKEYKQSVITETVTKGLDKSVELKDSGIQWIGRIPKHWKILKLKYISDCNQLVLAENTNSDQIIDYIEIGSVTNKQGINDYQTITFENAPSRARRIVKEGDTIISTVRTYLKAIAYIDKKYDNFICSTGFAVFTPTKKILPKFLFHALHSEWFVSTVEANSVGISYPAINTTNITNFKIAIPLIEEQQQILDYLDKKCSQIDETIKKKEELIEKLTEYKKSLIYECVTGKRKVSK